MSISDEPTDEAAFELRRRETLPLDTLLAELRARQGSAPSIALEALAHGIEGLDAILVIDLEMIAPDLVWLRPDTGISAQEISASLRDAYRTAQTVARALAPFGAQPEARAGRGAARSLDAASTFVTIEIGLRTALVRRIRGFIVACVLDGAQPIGLARLVARRIAAAIEPELPEAPRVASAAAAPAEPTLPKTLVSKEPELEPEPHTTAFRRSRTSIPPPRVTPEERDRAKRLLAYVDEHAPEPHVARLRLALRAGITPLALDHADALGTDAVILIETAVEEMFGLERDELRALTQASGAAT